MAADEMQLLRDALERAERDARRWERCAVESERVAGGGGGGNHESYQLAAYYIARHTATDAWDKRGKRGYLFLIGDERAYTTIDARQVQALIGDDLAQPLTTKEVFDELLERWDVYFLFAQEGSYERATVVDAAAATAEAHAWSDLLGQNVLMLEDATAVCETIALTIGLGEGTVALDEGLAHLREEGTDERAIEATSKALATVGGGTSVVPGDADADLDVSDGEGADRL